MASYVGPRRSAMSPLSIMWSEPSLRVSRVNLSLGPTLLCDVPDWSRDIEQHICYLAQCGLGPPSICSPMQAVIAADPMSTKVCSASLHCRADSLTVRSYTEHEMVALCTRASHT